MKRIIAILSISLLVLILSGCSATQTAEVVATIEETIKETTVKDTTVKEITVKETTAKVVEELPQSMEQVVDEIKTLMEKYNGLTIDELKLVDGWIDENKKLEASGYYMIFNNDTSKIKIMTIDEAVDYISNLISNGGNYDQAQVSKATSEIINEGISKVKKKQAQAQAEAFSSEVSSHIKSGSGVATVINDLNPYGYTTNNLGYVVPTLQAYQHMQTLKSGEFNLYRQTELEVFKKNNVGKVTITNKQNEDYSGTQGTFNSWGHPSWVWREPNFQTTNALGGTVYAVCDNTLEEFRPYCDGTLIAFKGWHEKSYDPNSAMWYYNNGVLDSNLGAFVDWNYEWIGGVGERKFRKVN